MMLAVKTEVVLVCCFIQDNAGTIFLPLHTEMKLMKDILIFYCGYQFKLVCCKKHYIVSTVTKWKLSLRFWKETNGSYIKTKVMKWDPADVYLLRAVPVSRERQYRQS